MVSLLNDFACELLGLYYFHNSCHILCTCIYLCEYSCGNSNCSVMKNVSRIEYINATFLHCVLVYVYSNFLSV